MRTSTDLLPALPADPWDTDPDHFTLLDGYPWLEQLRAHDWQPVHVWGTKGWNLGLWPYMVAAHHDGAVLYGLATYTEGDITVEAFETREERDAATNALAVTWWLANENGPGGLTEDMSPIPAAYCGPYTDH